VREHPDLFVIDGTPESEWPTPFDDEIAAAEFRPKAAPKPAPRIDPSTPVGDLRVCHSEVLGSSVGQIAQGLIVHKNDFRYTVVPEVFSDFMDTIGG